MVGSFYFLLHSWLAGIAGRNKLLINTKAHLQRCAFCFAFIWFRVQGSGFRALVAASPPFWLGDARKCYFSHGLPVITTIWVAPYYENLSRVKNGAKSTPFIILYWKLMRTMWLSESKVWLLSNSLPALSISSSSSFSSFLYWIGCNNLLQDL